MIFLRNSLIWASIDKGVGGKGAEVGLVVAKAKVRYTNGRV